MGHHSATLALSRTRRFRVAVRRTTRHQYRNDTGNEFTGHA